MPLDCELTAPPPSHDLLRALESALDSAAPRLASVALRRGDALAQAFVADGGVARLDGSGCALEAGCLAKLLTATLVVRRLGAAGIDLDARLVDVVDAGRASESLARVTLRQLLEHTHGLDDSRLEPPTPHDRWLDLADLAARACAEPPIAAPGELYSYGSVGAWLVACLLERLFARRYAELLADLLLEIGIDRARAARLTREPICAANGGLALTTLEWLTVLRFAAETPGLLEGRATPLPGWSPLERGIRLGWKHHGAGWFGHQSMWPGSSALVRVNPRARIELAVSSRDHAASVIAARVLGGTWPELFDLRAPRPLPRDACVDVEGCAGRYGNARFDARILLGPRGIDLHVRDLARGTTRLAELLPAAERTFFVRGTSIEWFPYVQIVRSRSGGEPFLWNGRFVLRRL